MVVGGKIAFSRDSLLPSAQLLHRHEDGQQVGSISRGGVIEFITFADAGFVAPRILTPKMLIAD